MTLRRVQMSRRPGWRLPDTARYVGRPTRWGNLWTIGTGELRVTGQQRGPYVGAYGQGPTVGYDVALPGGLTDEQAVALYRADLEATLGDFDIGPEVRAALDDLAGYDLACWCHLDAPWCHADVLLELANPGWTRPPVAAHR